MYCNFTKCHAFPIAIRVSSQQPKCFLQLYINLKTPKFAPNSNQGKPLCCSRVRKFRTSAIGFIDKTHEYSISNSRRFSTLYSRNVVESSESGKPLPWLAKNQNKEVEDYEKSAERFTKNGRLKIRRKDFKQKSGTSVDESDTRKPVGSSWEESAKKFVKNGVGNTENGRRFDERNDYRERREISENEPATRNMGRSSWEESAKKFVQNGAEEESDFENEEVDNPKWYKIQERWRDCD